jgi:hypothetical protein
MMAASRFTEDDLAALKVRLERRRSAASAYRNAANKDNPAEREAWERLLSHAPSPKPKKPTEAELAAKARREARDAEIIAEVHAEFRARPEVREWEREAMARATAGYILNAGRQARGESPPDPEHGDDGDRDKPKKSPPDPEHGDDDDQKNAAPGDLILRAIRRRRGK